MTKSIPANACALQAADRYDFWQSQSPVTPCTIPLSPANIREKQILVRHVLVRSQWSDPPEIQTHRMINLLFMGHVDSSKLKQRIVGREAWFESFSAGLFVTVRTRGPAVLPATGPAVCPSRSAPIRVAAAAGRLRALSVSAAASSGTG
jgi:hypothetical protein